MATESTQRRVVVTGLGVVTPIGETIDTFWDNLIAGKCGVDRISLFDPAQFDCQIAAEVRNFDPLPAFPSPKEERRSDRFSKFALKAGLLALQDSGLDLDRCDRDSIGVIIGSGIGGL
ncbi:MAG TPA: beta-ketoacyl synthase N-terminal-like domain-containing protein, partial [Verrucomicrobiota bacterium]|nr:beta-ketoacyl synthase N-terminal-like domain-containing protein [Verrucomicrobiota bacterium]